MAQPEANESAKIVKWLNQQPHTTARKRHVTVYGVRGDADIYFCTYGRHAEIETKRVGQKSRVNQQKRQEQWTNAYAPVRECHTLKEAQDFYYEILATIPDREK